jgi:hypothetical protein
MTSLAPILLSIVFVLVVAYLLRGELISHLVQRHIAEMMQDPSFLRRFSEFERKYTYHGMVWDLKRWTYKSFFG